MITLSRIALLLLAFVYHARAGTLVELCVDPDSSASLRIMGRPHSANLGSMLAFYCNFADSPSMMDVDSCETLVGTLFVDAPNIVLRGESSDVEELKAHCSLHKHHFTRHVATVQSIKELGGWISMDMVQYAEVNGCYGIDDVTLTVHFDEAGKVDFYHMMDAQKGLFDCLIQKQADAMATEAEGVPEQEL